MSKTLLVMAGGTGGHVFPGLAVADLMKSRGWNVVWMGSPDGIENKLVLPRGYDMAWVRFAALRGKGWLRKLMLPVNLLSGFWQAAKAIRRIKPDVVLGMGGYISFPGGMMAALFNCPLVIHEQNSVAGLANRVLAKVADRVLCGFPDTLPNSTYTGNPVRPEIAQMSAPGERFTEREPTMRLLVIGGSLGASVLNEVLPQGLAMLEEDERPHVVHQSGEKHLEQLEQNYAAAGIQAHCVAFIDNMAGAYEWADLVICRAGALTVSELAAAGVASILVPFPHAVDDHQTSNAKFLAAAGGAILLPQSEMTPESISLIRNYTRSQLLQMAERARALAKPEATSEVAAVCEEISKSDEQ
ncbi:MAG: undecaprenyldiphospho-muramoylpentapeptide beta-N-acetylglucosaminyltransferase [Propionivibrio sp.]|uniref:undecaprenyldiphospho-muramoylpentapeptide beta-N-acetylglucosaminyltransferase n=1 Tax=Propionivibrio sp. TaxID=2212460 RepID=UPI0025E14B94|nr:undecaprenyldiphospho-muramoylpentapeptide beta-N-acetylglucosaminyltransferase [Propionivibrio sp.]MBK8895516.1 undecaprenyldiphospho-muramoylpentapeptide beta-N-acetylglucosaminyltransferase [Propionivibrio sp.]